MLNLYASSKQPLELEIRFKNINHDVFTILYNAALQKYKSAGLEFSINTITSIQSKRNNYITYHGSKLRQQIFDTNTNKKISDKYIEKKHPAGLSALQFNDILAYSVNLNQENTIAEFKSQMDANIRIKLRSSFYMPGNEWRIDFTAIYQAQLANIYKDLPARIKSLFKPMTPETFLTSISYDLINKYEVEIEHIGEHKLPIAFDFLAAEIMPILSTQNSSLTHVIVTNVASKILSDKRTINLYRTGKFGIKQLLNQPVTLTRYNYADIYPCDKQTCFVTEKADGYRGCILYENSRDLHIISHILQNHTIKTDLKTTILDAEVISPEQILVFDCMHYDGVSIIDKTFEERYEYVKKAVAAIGAPLVAKHMVRLDPATLKTQFDLVYRDTKYNYNIDGMMLVLSGAGYFNTQWFKFKPPEHNTIDFLVMKASAAEQDRPAATLYILFVGINYAMQTKLGLMPLANYKYYFPNVPTEYYPIQFSPSTNPKEYLWYRAADADDLHGKIVEVRKDGSDWTLVKIRDDRAPSSHYYGNNFKTAEIVYQNYFNPLMFEDLYTFRRGYFTKTALDLYKAKNAFHRFIATIVFKKYIKPGNSVIDLGSGRGGDIQRYRNIGVKNILFVDKDKDALLELISRKFESRAQHSGAATEAQMKIYVLEQDLKEPAGDIISNINKFETPQFNTVVSNFAVHYFADSAQNMKNVADLCSIISAGGYVMFSIMSGQKVAAALEDVQFEHSWKLYEGEVIKYEIKKLYTEKSGKLISVRHPFSDELYEEPLCFTNELVDEFKTQFKLVEIIPFESILPLFEKTNYTKFGKYTDVDKQYSALHEFIIFQKI